MSDNTYSGIPSREEIQSMSTPELVEILRQGSYDPSDSASDAELIFYILEVLETREDAQGSAPKQNPKEAFEKFQKLYLDPDEDGISMGKTKTLQQNKKPQVIRIPKWLRSIAAVAAVLVVVLIAGSVTIKAAGLDPRTLFANWTKDIFYFSPPEGTAPSIFVPDVSDLEQALEKNNVEFSCTPHWLPDGYRLFDVYESVTPRNTTITAEFINGTQKVFLVLRGFSSVPNPVVSEKSELDVEPYVQGGCTYYLFMNADIVSASWYVDNWECSLYGPITMDDLKHIISSFYEGK